ncbi:MAG TPA: GNAT family N-acetyltransferase [Roseiflexaceae bacterium]|nr:GNAT family N-acetyltransferase [Roseiflexaceae bacterium]
MKIENAECRNVLRSFANTGEHMSNVTLREATADEAEVVAATLRAAFEEYRGWLDPPSGAHGETAEKIRREMRDAQVVLAQLGDTIAGCVFYAPVNQHIDLFRLAVLPEYRGRGIGRALIAYVEQRALELGFQRVQLGVRLQLPRNRALYERLGYQFVEARTHAGYSEPTYAILEKIL